MPERNSVVQIPDRIKLALQAPVLVPDVRADQVRCCRLQPLVPHAVVVGVRRHGAVIRRLRAHLGHQEWQSQALQISEAGARVRQHRLHARLGRRAVVVAGDDVAARRVRGRVVRPRVVLAVGAGEVVDVVIEQRVRHAEGLQVGDLLLPERHELRIGRRAAGAVRAPPRVVRWVEIVFVQDAQDDLVTGGDLRQHLRKAPHAAAGRGGRARRAAVPAVHECVVVRVARRDDARERRPRAAPVAVRQLRRVGLLGEQLHDAAAREPSIDYSDRLRLRRAVAAGAYVDGYVNTEHRRG